VISKPAANEPKALGHKIGVMRPSHLRFCELDAVFLPQNKSSRALFGTILPGPTAGVPAFKPLGSDIEILRSQTPQSGPVWVQHDFECTIWGDFVFVFAVRNTQSD